MNDKPVLNYRRPAFIGLLALIALLGGGVAWLNFAKVAGAVIASGSVIVEGKPKSIQHLDGGIVKVINISAGDQVKKDQILIELDDTTISANLSIYKGRLRDAIVRRARLLSELAGEKNFKAPTELIAHYGLGSLESTFDQQLALMEARHLTRQSQLAQLDEKISQFANQIDGVEGLITEKSIQIETFKQEAKSVQILVDQNLVAESRLMGLNRARADMRGQIAEHKAEIARIKNSISETKISKLQVEREFREKVISEIEQIEPKIDELRQQMDATDKQLSRVAIRSPVSGIVHELNLFTIGGVVQPGQVLMQIIAQTDKHEIELSVDTRSIDQIYVGQRAIIRLPAFHQRTTPELDGTIIAVSPTSVVDEKSGAAFYRLLVSVSDEEMQLLDGKKLVPGMPVEAFIPTNERTVLTYLIKPLSDQFNHAFREE